MPKPPQNPDLGQRLRAARLAAGLSTREVAAQLRRSHKVSHATLANYERRLTQPTLGTLEALAALYQRPISWFIACGPQLSGIRYRNLVSRFGARERERFEAEVQKWVEAYVRLEDRLRARRRSRLNDVPRPEIEPMRLAEWIRDQIGIEPDQPIPSVIDLLDRFGVYAFELRAPFAVDGLAALYGQDRVIVLNSDVAHDRARMNAAHELAHLLYNDCDGHTKTQRSTEEHRAMEFASHLLMPPAVLHAAFNGRSMVRLVGFKERYGISLAAMVYRAEKEGIIPNSLAKKLWVEFSKRGWRRREPGSVRPDRATRFEQLLDGAIVRGDLTWREAVEITGIRADELKDRVQQALGFDNDYPTDSGEPEFLRLIQ